MGCACGLSLLAGASSRGMFGMPSRMLRLVLALCCACCCARAGGPSVKTCDQFVGNATSPDIVYSRRWLDGEGGRMLYAWSMHASPTLFLSHSTDQLSCNNSLHSSGLPDHWNVTVPGVNGDFAAAIAFTRLIEFSVTDKKARSVDAFNASLAYMSDDTNCTDKSYCSYRFDSEDLEWDYSTSSRTFHLFEGNGSYLPYDFFIRTSLTTEAGGSRLPYFPKSILTINNTALDFVMNNFTYRLKDSKNGDDSYYKTNRLALELMIIHGPQVTNGSVSKLKNFDDEYTPAMFTTYNYQFGRGSHDSASFLGYLQWKPVTYTSGGRTSTSSQQVNLADTSGVTSFDSSVPDGLALAVFGQRASNVTLVYLVFGTSGDDSALSTPYLTWTSTMGYGQPPEDSISVAVLATIIAGLGIPAVLVLLGAAFVVYKRRPWQNVARLLHRVDRTRTNYETLN